MGNDGGSIPRRCELVKEKKKEEKPDPVELERAKWRVCTMTNEPLKEPIVVDDLGHLYNKESILNHLKVLKGIADPNTPTTTSTTSAPSSSSSSQPLATLSSSFSHITSLKDIVQINCTRNPSLSKDKKTSETSSIVVCPITQLETGHYKFIVIRSCGCVMSERAIKEIPSDTCLVCGKNFNKETDIIPLNPSIDELANLKKRMEERKQQEKNSRKKRKSSETTEKSEKSEKMKIGDHQTSSSSSKNVDNTHTLEKKKKTTIDNLLPPSTITTTTTTTSSSSSATTKKSIPVISKA